MSRTLREGRDMHTRNGDFVITEEDLHHYYHEREDIGHALQAEGQATGSSILSSRGKSTALGRCL
jgi:hypothetical protein